MPRLHLCPACGTLGPAAGRCSTCRHHRNAQRRTRPGWAEVYNTARWKRLRLAVLRRDNNAMGRTSAELLLARLRDDAPPSDVVLPTVFVARPSGAPP